ncbi:YSC84-related protein [Roseovarius sp. S1116L3]|uniref:YSC84-related protein n=1 Tax=Roseovarius roseus TaxID=3342636 RepID=UPI00372725D8
MQSLKSKLSAPVLLALALAAPSVASAADMAKLDEEVIAALNNCIDVSESCAERQLDAEGVLVFPDVLSVELGVGGAGGHGALVQNGAVTGHYSLGEATAGLEAGIDVASYIFVIETPEALEKIESGKWSVGADAGITVVDGATAKAESTADVYTYVVGSRGLDANIAVDVLRIWPDQEG